MRLEHRIQTAAQQQHKRRLVLCPPRMLQKGEGDSDDQQGRDHAVPVHHTEPSEIKIADIQPRTEPFPGGQRSLMESGRPQGGNPARQHMIQLRHQRVFRRIEQPAANREHQSQHQRQLSQDVHCVSICQFSAVMKNQRDEKRQHGNRKGRVAARQSV